MKFYVSELENWGSQHGSVLYHWRSFRSQLQPLVDLTNLMLLGRKEREESCFFPHSFFPFSDKNNIAVSMLRDGAPSLTILQVKFLLDAYGDSKDPSEHVPKTVLKEISDAASMDFSQKVPYEKAMLKDKMFNLSDAFK